VGNIGSTSISAALSGIFLAALGWITKESFFGSGAALFGVLAQSGQTLGHDRERID
jgi:hypothetical protein